MMEKTGNDKLAELLLALETLKSKISLNTATEEEKINFDNIKNEIDRIIKIKE